MLSLVLVVQERQVFEYFSRTSARCVFCDRRDCEKVDPRNLGGDIAYVMQHDALFATQTPREALEFSAALRLLTKEDRTKSRTSHLVRSLSHSRDCTSGLVASVYGTR